MRTSADGINLIKKFEGLRLDAYLCPAGVWTIGYGHTSDAGPPRVVPGLKITPADATDILRRDLRKYELAVENAVTVPLKPHQFDALASLCYNIGPPSFQRSSLVRKLNRGEYDAVPAELMKWNKAGGRELPGLTRRRRAEAALWRKVDESAPLTPEEAAVKPDAPKPRRSITQSREANTAAIAGTTAAVAAVGETSGHLKAASDNLGVPVVAVFVVIAIACGLIWWFRKQRLEENGE